MPTKRILSWAALGFGTIALAALLWAVLDLARIQDSHGGEEFKRSASTLRWLVLAEILVVVISASIVVWRSRNQTARLAISALVLWILSLFDLALLSLAGAVPR